jgi:hypothetical protein
MSGYMDDAIMLREALQGDAPFVHKPFTYEALLRKVRDVLDRRH